MKFTNALNILKDDSGATAIEYGLIAGLVSVVAITALSKMGVALTGLFDTVEGELSTAASS